MRKSILYKLILLTIIFILIVFYWFEPIPVLTKKTLLERRNQILSGIKFSYTEKMLEKSRGDEIIYGWGNQEFHKSGDLPGREWYVSYQGFLDSYHLLIYNPLKSNISNECSSMKEVLSCHCEKSIDWCIVVGND